MVKRSIIAGIIFLLIIGFALYAIGDNNVNSKINLTIVQIEDGTEVEQDLETYITKVVAGNFDENSELEAMKAFSVVVRTFVMSEALKEYDKKGSSTFCEKINEKINVYADQIGFKIGDAHKKSKQAAELTKSQLLTNKNQLIVPLFHDVSAGYTRNYLESTSLLQANINTKNSNSEMVSTENNNAEIANTKNINAEYMVRKLCEGDKQSEDYIWVKDFEVQDISDAIFNGKVMKSSELLEAMSNIHRDTSGYVIYINVMGEMISGEKIAQLLNLNSSCFYMEKNSEKIRIVCKGKGHGFGMSLYGSNEMAKNGMKYDEILKYFFSNINIIRISGEILE